MNNFTHVQKPIKLTLSMYFAMMPAQMKHEQAHRGGSHQEFMPRRERRKLARETARYRKPKAGPNRRELLVGGGALALTAAIAIAAGEVYHHNSDELTDNHTGQEEDMAISSYIDSTGGLKPNDQEITLFNYFNTLYPHTIDTNQPIDATATEIVKKRIYTTVDYLKQSSLPFFNNAGNFIEQYTATKELAIVPVDNFNAVEAQAFMLTGSVLQKDINNKSFIEQDIFVDDKKIIDNSSGLEMALGLTHEVRHASTRIQYLKLLSSALSTEVRLNLLKAYAISDRASDEVQAYADQAEATIDLIRAGITALLPPDWLHLAGNFARCNADRSSKAWKDYIYKRLGLI